MNQQIFACSLSMDPRQQNKKPSLENKDEEQISSFTHSNEAKEEKRVTTTNLLMVEDSKLNGYMSSGTCEFKKT